MANRHTIILMQTSQNRATRTFKDYDSISQAMDEAINKNEEFKTLHNKLVEKDCFDPSIQAYLPNDRQWIKQRLFHHLKKLASR